MTVFEQTDESSAFQQCYIVLYDKYSHIRIYSIYMLNVCNTNHFLQVSIGKSNVYIICNSCSLFI